MLYGSFVLIESLHLTVIRLLHVTLDAKNPQIIARIVGAISVTVVQVQQVLVSMAVHLTALAAIIDRLTILP